MLPTVKRPRIIGGTAKGRHLLTPKRGTRPTPSRVREALFDVLAFEPKGRFLDLYSGSGAVGLEAASRGFQATCVEWSRDAARVIERNAEATGLDVEVVRGDALEFAAANPGAFRVVFASPPYPEELPPLFTAILTSGAAEPGGLFALQHPSDLNVAELPAATLVGAVRVKRYGSNSLTFVRVPELHGNAPGGRKDAPGE